LDGAGASDTPDALIVDRDVDADPSGRALLCYHCGETLPLAPVQQEVDGELRGFCCHGCGAAAEWIGQSELGDYYRLRSAAATRVEEMADLASWDRDDLLGEHAVPVAGGLEITLLTDGMRCAACAWLIDQALRREPGASASAGIQRGFDCRTCSDVWRCSAIARIWPPALRANASAWPNSADG
jgi:Cu2+-exporting ATPase